MLRRVVTKTLEPFGSRVVPILSGPARGARMELVLAREKAYWAGTYERPTQAALVRLSARDATAWDLGAHVGFFALLLGRRTSGVVAVEASPSNVVRLRRNVELNRARVEVVHAAVSATDGVVTLAPHAESFMWKVGPGDERVDAVTLDGLLERFGAPALVKLDVEGAEADALEAAPRLLAARPAFVVEMHGDDARDRVLAALRAAGYTVDLLGPWRAVAT